MTSGETACCAVALLIAGGSVASAASSRASASVLGLRRIASVGMGPLYPKPRLLPGKHRLFQVGNPGVPADQHLTELIDHRCRRRVDQAFFVMKTDHAPRALGDRREVERIRALDQI